MDDDAAETVDAEIVHHLRARVLAAVDEHGDAATGGRVGDVGKAQTEQAGAAGAGGGSRAAVLGGVEAVGGDEVEVGGVDRIPGAVLGTQEFGHAGGGAIGLQGCAGLGRHVTEAVKGERGGLILGRAYGAGAVLEGVPADLDAPQ